MVNYSHIGVLTPLYATVAFRGLKNRLKSALLACFDTFSTTEIGSETIEQSQELRLMEVYPVNDKIVISYFGLRSFSRLPFFVRSRSTGPGPSFSLLVATKSAPVVSGDQTTTNQGIVAMPVAGKIVQQYEPALLVRLRTIVGAIGMPDGRVLYRVP